MSTSTPCLVALANPQALRQQGEVLAKAEGQLAEGIRVNRENIEEMQVSPQRLELPRSENAIKIQKQQCGNCCLHVWHSGMFRVRVPL